MSQQASVFFVCLKGKDGTVVLNIADIIAVVPWDDGSHVTMRCTPAWGVRCLESPDEVALKIQQAISNSVTAIARMAYEMARKSSYNV